MVDQCSFRSGRTNAISILLRNMPITIVMGTGPVGEDFNALYNMAKIALVVSCNGDLTHRVFNNMASGCLVIMDKPIKDADKLQMQDCVQYMGFEDEVTLVGRVQQALYEPEVRKVIVERAKRWVIPHTFQSRCEYVLQECGLIAQEKANAIGQGV